MLEVRLEWFETGDRLDIGAACVEAATVGIEATEASEVMKEVVLNECLVGEVATGGEAQREEVIPLLTLAIAGVGARVNAGSSPTTEGAW